MAFNASISSPVSKFALTGMLLAALLTGGNTALARTGGWGGEGTEGTAGDSIALAQLPVQGQRTYQAILNGGPFRYEKDGSVFGNRERQLPRERRGHYREYTVETPGAGHRAARRIVCGGAPTTPDACWYTADHYASFKRIVP